MRANSLAFRLVASAATWCALLLSATGVALSMVFGDTVERNFDERLSVLLEGLVAGSEIGPEGELDLRPSLGEPRFLQPLSGWYWQIDQETQGGDVRRVARSASLWDYDFELSLGDQAMEHRDANGPDRQGLRLVVRRIVLPGATGAFYYAVAGDRSEILADVRGFNRLLAFTLAAVFAGLLIAIFLQVRFGLEPLRRSGRALAAIRAGRTRRLQGTFADELRPLVTELNALLDHNEALVERARTHVGNLAHGLKTPLAVLTNEAGREEGPLADLVTRQSAIMSHQVEHHLARARAVATAGVIGARTEVGPVVGDLARTLERIHRERDLRIQVSALPGLVFRGARQDLEEMVGNLLDNACKWARGSVRLDADHGDDRVTIVIEDDGPGLPLERRSEVLARGKRLDEAVPGSGLGLAIVADVAQLYGGTLALDDASIGGLRATLSVPAAAAD